MPAKIQRSRLILLISICSALVLILSACNFPLLNNPSSVSLGVRVDAPAIVSSGKDFQVSVEVSNTGNSTILVDEIRLPKSFLEGAVVTGMDPISTATTDYTDQVGYEFTLIQDPGTSTTVVFSLRALAVGDYSGDLSVAMGGKSQDSSVRVVVQEAAVVATSEPITSEAIPYHAVVQIIARVSYGGEIFDGWTGSGTIISSGGMILTNAHVILSDGAYQVSELVICLTNEPDELPEPTYIAEVLQADADLDLAVIQIVSDLDGNPVDPADLNLPAVPLGDSDALQLGDAITILGYPGIGGETITLTRGEVAGFTAEAGYGNRAFIKTSATIAGGNSGGLAANASGQIIGIPTEVGYGGEGDVVDCRPLADTNRDGVINDNDDCIPIGGYINALRPIALALPLIEAAQQGEVSIESGNGAAGTDFSPSGPIIMQDDFSDAGSGWGENDQNTYSALYHSGQMVITVQPANEYNWSIYEDEDFSDVQIAVDTEILRATYVAEYGIICNYRDSDNFYGLSISEDGYYTIYKFSSGNFEEIVGWTPTDLIDQGEPATITATCANGTLSLAYNDVLLVEAEDHTFSSGQIGLLVYTYDTPNVIVGFDNVVVRQK